MKAPQAPDDHRAKGPDHDHRPDKISPLDAEAGYGAGSENEHGNDAEVRRVPDVAIVDAQHILRGDGNQRAQGIRPEGWRAHQDADADAGDVGTGQVWPLAQVNARQNQFSNNAGANRQQGAGVTFKDTVRELAYQQDTGD